MKDNPPQDNKPQIPYVHGIPPEPAQGGDNELRKKIYYLASFIVDYEFVSPNARYRTRESLIEKYAGMIEAFVTEHTAQARIELLERVYCCDHDPINTENSINVCNGDHIELLSKSKTGGGDG